MSVIALYIAFAFLASCYLTGKLRLFLSNRGIFDIPNQRSSHVSPTPRGGGLIFSGIFLASTCLFVVIFPASRNIWIALAGGGFLVSAVGWIDDRSSLSSKLRLLIYCFIAAWAAYWLGGLPAIWVGFKEIHLGNFGAVLAWLGVIWFINMYNFMDGIDGLAAGNAVVVGIAAGVFLTINGDVEVALACFLLAAVAAGFLRWNWSPAKIFMGDVGSNLLGFALAVLVIAGENRGSLPALLWAMLLAVFIVDTLATLLHRIYRHEAFLEAHCSHAYQKAVRSGFSHSQVTTVILLIDVLIVALAVIANHYQVLMIPLIALTVSCLLLLWRYFHFSLPQEEIFAGLKTSTSRRQA